MTSSLQTEQKVAIVTGAARGIGSWLATYLHKRGYRVALCDLLEADGQAVASSLDPTGDSATFLHCDVKSYQDQSEVFKSVWAKWSRIDVLIANAGCVDQGSVYNFGRRNAAVSELPAQPNTDCTDTDFKGVVYGTALATHFMRHNPAGTGGKIIVTGSMIGIYPCATFPEYCSAKAAVHQWVKTVGPVLRKKENITINCVMPGAVATSAMPDFHKAFLPQHLTLYSTLLSGYEAFLEDTDNSKTGQTVEAAHDKLFDWGHPGYKSGEFAERTEKIYEPWFSTMHGENSKLPGTLDGPSEQEEGEHGTDVTARSDEFARLSLQENDRH